MAEQLPSDELTHAQRKVFKFVQAWIKKNGFPPTRTEISIGLGFASANAAEEHLRAIARKGHIQLTRGISRGIRLKATS